MADARDAQAAREELRALAAKIDELEADADEHRLVLAALEPLPAERRCYRRVGGVLVESTVARTAPVLCENLAGIDKALGNMREAARRREAELSRLVPADA